MAVAALVLIAAQDRLLAKPLACPNNPAAANTISAEDLKSLAASGNSIDRAAALDRIVATLRDRGMSAGNIVDNLVSAYCPIVAANAALDDRQKATTVRSFASQASRAVYAPEEADEIILDVPLPPAAAKAINDKAKAERMSPQEWAAKIIINDLKTAR
ncbi:hypothetical protein [Pseudorhodoplanes sinuspersici]|uniref:Uncharacterized protein n=1 Tax=Pseudorhodoplanes sinuspersici TaxID=1235591 RepID=A0A1W6ZML7_9HYPH|nr:hypothetical protein [Pseudorhodoplanes sinuspersici]ARP98611.1 hypothetical protein CAK95_05590 [Pseudorhodoplanes sinuspersici]RKE69807.1 hypothetical protein DFP91_4249 [Pseudorhodoplanes sinuspersici]